MNICQVTTGMIPVKPVGEMGWGAVEKIVREYKISLEKLGHTVDIKHLGELDGIWEKYDFIHCHMGNLALELSAKNIPYVFSLHDHHTEHYGKDSYCFRHNLDAMKKSIFSITHAEYLVDYFDATDKLFYLTHAVNTSFFKPSDNTHFQHKLLMVANNGLAGDYGFDRKGFRYGIEAARELGLPITVVGTEANDKFFQIHSDLKEYPLLNIVARNPTENELLSIYQDHTIFLHPSMLEAGHPNLTLLESASCCLPMAATYRGSKEIIGLFKLNELTTTEVISKVKEIIADYSGIRSKMIANRDNYDWINVAKTLSKMYHAVSQFHHLDTETIKNKYINVYSNTTKL
jgi:glycosyltransferase involved in cell wall biosynthesis